MTAKRLLGFTAFLALASLTAGCGGGTPGADGGTRGSSNSNEIIPLTSTNQLEVLAGARMAKPKSFASAAISGFAVGNGFATGDITFHGGTGGDGGDVKNHPQASAETVFRSPLMPADYPFYGHDELLLNDGRYTAKEMVAETITIGDDGAMVRHVEMGAYEGARGNRLFLPANGSDLHVAGITVATDFDGKDGIYHGIFGIRSTTEQVARREEPFRAKFTGVAEASLVGTDVTVGDERGGWSDNYYHGTSRAIVNTYTGEVDLTARMSNSAGYSMNLTSEATVHDDGRVTGNVTTISGALANGDNLNGKFKGHLFGPTASDLGGTFAAGFGEARGEYDQPFVAVSGMVIMSQDGPRLTSEQ